MDREKCFSIARKLVSEYKLVSGSDFVVEIWPDDCCKIRFKDVDDVKNIVSELGFQLNYGNVIE